MQLQLRQIELNCPLRRTSVALLFHFWIVPDVGVEHFHFSLKASTCIAVLPYSNKEVNFWGGNTWGAKQCPADSSNMFDFNNLILFIRASLLTKEQTGQLQTAHERWKRFYCWTTGGWVQRSSRVRIQWLFAFFLSYTKFITCLIATLCTSFWAPIQSKVLIILLF